MTCFAYQVISEIKEVSLQQQKGLRLLNLSSSNPNTNAAIHTCNRILTVGLKKKKKRLIFRLHVGKSSYTRKRRVENFIHVSKHYVAKNSCFLYKTGIVTK